MEDVKTVETQNTQVDGQEASQEAVEVEANEQVDKTPQKNKPTDVLRDLSKLLSVNLFDDPEAVTKVNQYLDSIKTEKQTLAEQVENSIKEKETLTAKEQEYQSKIEALGMGFQPDQVDEVIKLAKVYTDEGQPLSEGLKVVKEKYSGVFAPKKSIGLQMNDLKGDKPDLPRTEQEQYLAKNPVVQHYQKTKK